MSSEEIDMGVWLDETELVYCPRCGSELDDGAVVRCPEHGPLSIDYWELDEEDVALAEEIEGEFESFGEQLADEFMDAWGEAMDEQADETEASAQSRKPAGDGQPLRDRINRFIGRDR